MNVDRDQIFPSITWIDDTYNDTMISNILCISFESLFQTDWNWNCESS